jgi:hypothetical protein
MSNRHRKLSIEQMEAREMMAGDLAASVSNGNLYLNEAAKQIGRDNAVLVSQIAPGIIRVTGLATADGTVSKIGGKAYKDFSGVSSLFVNFGAGNDKIVFDGSLPPTFQDADILVGAPLYGGHHVYPPDKDVVSIEGGTILGSLYVDTGPDNDIVAIVNTQLGDSIGADAVEIYTGAGADLVDINGQGHAIDASLLVTMFSSSSENDADTVRLQNLVVLGEVDVSTGGGNDSISFDGVSAATNINIDAGAGDDACQLDHAFAADNFFANLGDGNDYLSVSGLDLNGYSTAKFDGGNGIDSLYLNGVTGPGQLSDVNWEYLNGRPIVFYPLQAGGPWTKP